MDRERLHLHRPGDNRDRPCRVDGRGGVRALHRRRARRGPRSASRAARPTRALRVSPPCKGRSRSSRKAFRAVGRSPASRLLVLLLGPEFVVIGGFDVLAVVLAIDLLDLGESGAGYLNTALGAGAVLGAIF